MSRPQLTTQQIEDMSKAQIDEYAEARNREIEDEAKKRREQADMDHVRRQFVAEGGSARDFAAHWRRLKDERAAARIRELDEAAGEQSARRARNVL